MDEIVNIDVVFADKPVEDTIKAQVNKRLKVYAGDFKRFEEHCFNNGHFITFESLEVYLYKTIQSGLKLTTFNRRSAAIKYHLENSFGLLQTEEQRKRIKQLRSIYNNHERSEQKRIRGQSALPKEEVIKQINQLDTRAKAISLLNLITACRPSEMIRLKVKNIDLIGRSVNVYMQKQSEGQVKRLTLECVNTVGAYIKKYGLTGEDYFVGKVDKHGNYYSSCISDTAYRKTIHKWLGFAPYTLRKTQVTAMHEAGADVATIAKQSGHKSLETITKHYLDVNGMTVDEYL
ncbi:tyrosine-type recombinase/integrase [Lysinibacillus sphaericus]|uniref:Site-specific recombinase XerD n=1 Tax=Lysinibacillus sphaericus OT4b.31 TaxID=1285586 RepID=R7ZG18_LYSSH|nr:site-specific integrase [Lysinibacillus sphaericus]EON72991.1 site-specific recombinase XerD [Lysinibacillus sphaericus OT4b.31]